MWAIQHSIFKRIDTGSKLSLINLARMLQEHLDAGIHVVNQAK